MKHLPIVIAVVAALAASSSFAQQSHQGMDMGGMKMDGTSSMGTSYPLTTGEVKAVNKERQMITLKHAAIKSATVEMSPMTMAFPVKDAAMLKNVKVGDTVKFTVENVKGQAMVTVLDPQT
ncbi:copper-binding protein [Oxalicibacterium solurbis]|uniref:Copper-binding protein n=1 Tax=Oxalicibacterium solurbis TaxID=69280 RepID=A0A8J3B0V7_9BURK|nr:copper-binding protein [Oxalicibacterium solurbis]GGI55676.1 hypothetical protein GCM10011430_28500 [Oxalicibacterium solurbis]